MILTINTDANKAVAKKANQILGKGTTFLTRGKVEELELFSWLTARTGRAPKALAKAIFKGEIDKRRLFTGAQRERIIARDGGCCAYCTRKLDADEVHYIDHVIPHSAGGQTIDLNGVLACADCNLSKSNRVW